MDVGALREVGWPHFCLTHVPPLRLMERFPTLNLLPHVAASAAAVLVVLGRVVRPLSILLGRVVRPLSVLLVVRHRSEDAGLRALCLLSRVVDIVVTF